ncbi:MAG: biosynthetic-type acetolactate synthase large subunit [Deltaproteobacteria bacterium]|nr:biosynthetic-type acetolactate synthase large subunit [Deltaproteobacteria bacterium]
MKLSGAEIFVECLKKEGVDTLFGYPGGVVLNIYDVLHQQREIRHILTKHEQGAVHAADGYARASGKPGVVLVTSGPGATNTVTGIATAYMDSIPLVIFTGQVPMSMIGNDAFQEADIVGITRPCTKHNYLVSDVSKLASTIKEAFHIATTGRKGPVLIDLPKDVSVNKTEFVYPSKVDLKGFKPTLHGNLQQIKRAVSLMRKAERPVLFTGGGVILSGAAEELKKIAKKTWIPVTSTLMGLGGFPGEDVLFLGMPGMHGTYVANLALQNADLIVAVGARFDDRVTGRIDAFAPKAEIVHIDIDPTSIKKNVRVDVPIVGDCRNTLRELNKLISAVRGAGWKAKHKAWLDRLAQWREKRPLIYRTRKGKIAPQYVVEEIYKATKGKAIITTEVGQNQMWAAQFYKFQSPRQFLTSGGLGTMGYGFPAAIGAQFACPDRVVFDIAGDGSIQMNIQELATAVQHRLPVNIAILDNRFLGMVRQWQQLFYDCRYSSTCLQSGPDFVKLAEAYGAVGIRVTKKEDVPDAVREAISIKNTVLLDFVIDREANVMPMVPAGAAIDEMIFEEKRGKKKLTSDQADRITG